MSTKALIFDFDGIITDTEPIHMDAWLGVLEPYGISFDEEEYRESYLGLCDKDFLSAVGRIHGCYFDEAEKHDLIETKAVESMRRLEHDVPLLPGVREFIGAAKEKYLLAICSGALRGEIEFILKKFGWSGVFNPVISAESIKKGKPDPEGYIRAFEGLAERARIMLLPEEVIAIEDSPRGITAAKAAGLRCIAVRNSYEKEALSSADIIVDALSDLDPDSILS